MSLRFAASVSVPACVVLAWVGACAEAEGSGTLLMGGGVSGAAGAVSETGGFVGTGGVPSTGGVAATGGSSSGGSASGGASSGGTGGSSTGGTNSGGTGGANSGGTGGTNSGGTGGTSSGGTGGTNSGGTGGTDTGGTGGTSSGDGPCAGICDAPVVFAGPSYSKSNIGAGAQCWETQAQLNGGNCGNTGGRTFTVNGATQTCSGSNWSSVPAAKNGGYCLAIAAGDGNDAWFSLW